MIEVVIKWITPVENQIYNILVKKLMLQPILYVNNIFPGDLNIHILHSSQILHCYLASSFHRGLITSSSIASSIQRGLIKSSSIASSFQRGLLKSSSIKLAQECMYSIPDTIFFFFLTGEVYLKDQKFHLGREKRYQRI